MKGNGYLAIWSDLAPEDETDWAHWITREHAAERVGIAGFLACRIFRAIGTAAAWRVAVAPLPNAAERANFADEQLPPWKDRTQ